MGNKVNQNLQNNNQQNNQTRKMRTFTQIMAIAFAATLSQAQAFDRDNGDMAKCQLGEKGSADQLWRILRDAFNLMDTNNDRVLDTDEFETVEDAIIETDLLDQETKMILITGYETEIRYKLEDGEAAEISFRETKNWLKDNFTKREIKDVIVAMRDLFR